MSKVIRMRLSTDSIDRAIKEIKEYRKWVQLKTVQFVKALASRGLTVIDSNKVTPGDSDASNTNAYVTVDILGTKAIAHLFFEGEDVAFIEFGAGASYNGVAGQSPNPFGAKLGYTIGSYGLGQGSGYYWYYKDVDGERKISLGTKAGMPVAKADEKIRNEFIDVAKAVFRW